MPHNDFSNFFDWLPIGSYRSSPDGRPLRANPALVRINGFDSEAEMLSGVDDLAGRWYVQPGRRDAFRALLDTTGEVRDFVSEVHRYKTRERIWVCECARQVRGPDGALLFIEGTVEDITARRQAEDALAVTLKNIEQGLMRFDTQGRVTFYSHRALEMLDLPEALLAGQPTASWLARWQEARGDFGANLELLESTQTRADFGEMFKGREIPHIDSYLRRTRTGRVLEVKTRALPDGGALRTYADVTAYVQAQQDLAQRTRSLEITLDSMSQGIATLDASGRIVTSNRRHQALLDFPEALMARRPTMEELVRFQIARGDFGENFSFVDALARGYVAVGDTTPPLQGPESYLRKTREGRTLEVRTRPLPDGGVVRTFTDMTDYVQAQEALAQKQALLSALVRNLPDRIWLKDTAGVYLLSNPAHQRQHGLLEQEIIGQSAHALFGDRYGEAYRQSDLQAMASDQPLVYEDRLIDRETGMVRYFELAKVAMRDEAGHCTGLLGIARDITARKESEAALIAARDAADAGNRAKAEFLANMSHEIRTPMNAVIGMSELLLDTPLTAQQQEFAETIRTSGDALLALINNILDFSRIESGRMELEQVPVNLHACVESALDISSGAAAAKGLDLLYWIGDEVPCAMLGDATRLRQVLVNLVHNAVKFTAHGEVVVTLALRHAPDTPPWLHCSVRDTGAGIPPARRDRLFQVFSQVDASTTRVHGGTGLGLAICRRLVTLMGGRIWVESTPGEGATFQFEIPCQRAPAGPGTALHERSPPLAGRRMLLLDRHATARELLARQARRWGMEVHATPSGLEALAWLDAGTPFDVALIDARVPGPQGSALIPALRQRRSTAQLPLLALTALGEDLQVFTGLGVADALTRPPRAQRLHDALTRVLVPTTAVTHAALVAGVRPPPRLARQVPLRIVLAEDNLVNQRVASLILSGLGYDIAVTGNGQQVLEAVAAAARQGQPVDVVLMDVQMPLLDGLQASRQLGGLYPATCRPWIIAMTANALEGDRADCLAAGMDDYLSKPTRAAALAEALQRASTGLAARRTAQLAIPPATGPDDRRTPMTSTLAHGAPSA